MEKAQVSNSDDLQGVGLDFLGAKKNNLVQVLLPILPRNPWLVQTHTAELLDC